MNQKIVLKVTSAALVATLAVGALAPTTKAFASQSTSPEISQSVENESLSVSDIKPVEEITEQDLVDLQREFKAAGLTDEDISNLFVAALPNLNTSAAASPVPTSEPTFGTMGLKGKSASFVAKQMIKEMKETGAKEFNKRMKQVVDGLKEGFKRYLGMNDFFAGMCARAITMVLL
jgi:hypothetical protein